MFLTLKEDTPIGTFVDFKDQSTDNLSLSLQSNNPIVGLSFFVLKVSSIAVT